VDHASPDTHLEDSFFKGGLSESVLTAQSEEAHDHEARVRSDRRQNAVYVGAAIAVAIALVGVVSSSSKTGHAPAAQAPASAAAPVQAERSALRGRAQPQAPAAQAAPVTSAVPVQAAAAPTTPLPAAPAPAAALPTAAAPAAALPAAVAPAAAPAPAGAIAALGGARPAPSPESQALRGTCEKALGGGKFKDVQTACSAAFDADHSAELASQVAQSALESGKKAEASAWAKKAIAANPDFADAYVFLGGAEQELGRKAEARAAYEKYLQLAPTGKFAEDIRAVVGTF
jgi:tetratricopeptide (TPR) repeat protein